MDDRVPASLLTAFGAAAAALARAEERLALFPEPDLLGARIRLAEQEALAWLEGAGFFPEQLAADYGSSPRAWRNWPFAFVRAFDRPLPVIRQSAALPTAVQVRDWLDPAGAGHGPSPLPPLSYPDTDRLEAWARRTRSSGHLPRLVAAADLAASFARVAPLREGNAVIGAMLAERYALADSPLSAGGIAAIGLHAAQVPWRALIRGASEDDLDEATEAGRDTRCRLAWLDGLARGAGSVIGLDQRLRLWLAQVERVCGTRRRSSHLRALALLAGKVPALTVSRAAEALDLSRQATTRLVAEACAAHLLREVTHGKAFRRYVVAI